MRETKAQDFVVIKVSPSNGNRFGVIVERVTLWVCLAVAAIEEQGVLRLPLVDDNYNANGHMGLYYRPLLGRADKTHRTPEKS